MHRGEAWMQAKSQQCIDSTFKYRTCNKIIVEIYASYSYWHFRNYSLYTYPVVTLDGSIMEHDITLVHTADMDSDVCKWDSCTRQSSTQTSHLIPHCSPTLFAPRVPRVLPGAVQDREKGSLDPDCVPSLASPGFHGQVSECGEELLHLLLEHVVPFLGILLRPLGVSHLDFYHGELFPLLIQFVMEAQHFRFQSQIPLLQAAEDGKGNERLVNFMSLNVRENDIYFINGLQHLGSQEEPCRIIKAMPKKENWWYWFTICYCDLLPWSQGGRTSLESAWLSLQSEWVWLE